MYIPRSIEPKIKDWLFREKIIVIYGARQTGKSTIVRRILADYSKNSRYFNGDETETRRLFGEAGDRATLKRIAGEAKIVVIDEAQKIENIGLKLKILVDAYPQQQIIATGSSSFDLANKIAEPLTGRTVQFTLYPLSVAELSRIWGETELKLQLPNLMIYGAYPAVVTASSLEEKAVILKQLVTDYLYRDVLSFDRVQKSEALRKLTEAISLQTGNEVSYNELSGLLQIGKQTVISYLDILEQGFIVFRLTSFARNLRQEINRSRKVYLIDTGVRNALINNLNPLSLRTDTGELWENFVAAEFKKQQYWAAKDSAAKELAGGLSSVGVETYHQR
ncbi:MAG: AAA ATPase [Candidatus Magasanikbacteria bacterium GW2011_GWA2_50_22]|uniref:AAA ATPase n=1 Tax=Candidatus Magasanikbacteria bacterium GW2011_GWA2_50_22 TaxID=1619043 RepID=A0A0G1WEK8_9BACT|nr:MAG: AAA ATPase [Candidatus Magasanikbacteria bacterium GW2011_GWA2_50_22]